MALTDLRSVGRQTLITVPLAVKRLLRLDTQLSANLARTY
ncbi:hypothetical protein M2272_004023 [Mycobacterium frederiksbergense]|uniref:Uncharacterized protein n=1 Tax=Mycolicibacterium frederiksbergense TaxID=117567 RepID=A0ABT6L352_9MYCO|nr:hypothetical protein [Mycolicibacterium frederiksbergense]